MPSSERSNNVNDNNNDQAEWAHLKSNVSMFKSAIEFGITINIIYGSYMMCD